MSTEKSSAGKAGDADAMGDLYRFLIFTGVGICLILYLQVLRNRKYWVIMETALGVVALLILPFENRMISFYQSTGVNPLVIYLFRLMAMARVSQSVVVYLTRNSKDPTVASAVSITNIITRITLIMCAINGILNSKTISQTALTTDLITTSLLIVGDAFQMKKLTTREGSLTIGNPISFHLTLGGVLEFVMASFVFGFSDMFLHVLNPGIKPSEGQIALSQVFGCFLFGMAILSFAALCFKGKQDGINILKSKLVLYVPAVAFGLSNYLFDANYRGFGHTVFLFGVMDVLALNAGYAVWTYEMQRTY